MDLDLVRLFEAHVRFELDRLQGDALAATVEQEVAAGLAWLESVPLRTLAPPEEVGAWIRRLVVDEPLTDELFDEIDWAVRAAHESLLEEPATLRDLVPPERYEQLVQAMIGLGGVRREAISQVTANSVYAELISHVLYHGLKDYLLTENAVVRKLPGASSLLRMGQNAVRSATPNLEAEIDRRLLAFIAANVAETIRDSREFLDRMLDETALRKVAGEVWDVNAPRTLADFAGLVEEASLSEVVMTGTQLWLALRTVPAVARVVDQVVEQFYRAHGDEPVAVLLADLGFDQDRLTRELRAAAALVVTAARDDGRLEAYVRSRLDAFYSTYRPASDPA